jgi:hypothetical protein
MNEHKYITWNSSQKIYYIFIPSALARELGRSRQLGKRVKLEEAIKLRDDFLAKNSTTVLEDDVNHKPSFTESGDGKEATVSVKGSRITTVDELLDHCKVDRKVWEVADNPIIGCWDMTNKDGQRYQNFQIKVKLKKKFHEVDLDYLSELLADMPKPLPIIPRSSTEPRPHLLEVNIFDVHIGKLCWAPETGDNYDLSIARQKFMSALSGLISLTEAWEFDKILFPIGSDFFNIDNLNETTTRGTPQQMEGRYPKMVAAGVALVIEAIDILRNFAPVEVVNIPGNHDEASDYWLAHLLKYRYADDDSVYVDDSPRLRKAIQFHDCMIALAHGDGPKKADWPKLAASEFAELWGRTKFREYHLGHTHHEHLQEHPGMTVRWLGSISPADKWHDSKGFTGNRQSASAFVWKKGQGVVANLTCNV